MATQIRDLSARWWGKAALAGVVGALVFGLYEMIATLVTAGSLWLPLNMIAGTFDVFRPPSPDFVTSATLTGLVLHMITGAIWGVVYGALAASFFPRALTRYGTSAVAGLIYGLGVYLVMGLFIGPMINPVMLAADPVNYFIGHLIYGLVTALTLTALTSRRDVSITYAPAGVREHERIEH